MEELAHRSHPPLAINYFMQENALKITPFSLSVDCRSVLRYCQFDVQCSLLEWAAKDRQEQERHKRA
ncbi:hypothetical protein KC19_9G065600 [Ceratodon purpureus]|uniref:Uncharacterized protein n=1 Tax=Ceratodon purpureus TaxID=3225 RepID=A0A8T0GSV7_CERPU|nr:hypothetical protein KC19_9G065600 [Ceratodon purpureus]